MKHHNMSNKFDYLLYLIKVNTYSHFVLKVLNLQMKHGYELLIIGLAAM